MELLNQKVTHKQFGEGVITHMSDQTVVVQFKKEEKKFMYPEGFIKFLVLKDQKIANVINDVLEVKAQELKEIELQKEAAIEENRKKQQRQLEYEKLTNNHKLHAESQVVFSCDKDELAEAFQSNKIFAGEVKNGARKGEPVKVNRVHQNTAVLLTHKEGSSEEQRYIHGIFMVKKGYIGKLSKSGVIPMHATYKIELTEDESKQLPLWKYYFNKKSPDKMSWDTGKFRYFENEWLAHVLLDLYSIKTDESEKQLVQQFLFHFCKMNKLAVEDLKDPKGLLA